MTRVTRRMLDSSTGYTGYGLGPYTAWQASSTTDITMTTSAWEGYLV